MGKAPKPLKKTLLHLGYAYTRNHGAECARCCPRLRQLINASQAGGGVFFFFFVWLGSVFFFVWLGSAGLAGGPFFLFFSLSSLARFFSSSGLARGPFFFFLRLAWLGWLCSGPVFFFFSVSGLARFFSSSGLARLGLARGPFFFCFFSVSGLARGPFFFSVDSLCLAWFGFLGLAGGPFLFLLCVWLGSAWLRSAWLASFLFSASGLARLFWLGSEPVFFFFFPLCVAWLGFYLRLVWLGVAWPFFCV